MHRTAQEGAGLARLGILETSVCLRLICLFCTLALVLGNSQQHKRSFLGVKRNIAEAWITGDGNEASG